MNKQDKVYVMEFKGRIHDSADRVTLRVFENYAAANEYIAKNQSVKVVKYWTSLQIVSPGEEVNTMSMSPDPDNPDVLYEY